jgi:N4-bis(aminopropyl)spermidine synthase
MAGYRDIDLRAAINAISDVIQNRPRPIRTFDQIYMKAGDMVLQSELVAKWADGKRLAFIGDGDAISVCVAYLKHRKIFDYGPTRITVFDFDQRICNAVNRFADNQRLETLSAVNYNVIDSFLNVGDFDCFYTNPPWGASNEGASVHVFAQRGMEATGYSGEGMIVIADDHELEWPQVVLSTTQKFSIDRGFYVQKMASQVHLYHLDDAPDLKSCNLMIKALPNNFSRGTSLPITDVERLNNFYGRDQHVRIRYVKEKSCVDYGKAQDSEYEFELFSLEA